MALATVALLWPAAPLVAQEGMTREERLRQHEERVREIIERRRREQLQREEGRTPSPPEVTVFDDDPDERPAVSDAPILGTVMLYTLFRVPDTENERQIDLVTRVGERVVTEVRIQNTRGTPMDRVRIALNFDKRFLRPLGVFDHSIRGYLDGPPRFEVNQRDGTIIYDARLDEPRGLKDISLLTIVWEPLRVTEHTALRFVFASGDTERAPHTAIYQGNRNILGDPSDPFDGVLGSSVLVMEPFDPDRQHNQILQGKYEELQRMYREAIGAQQRAGLRLVGPDRPIVAGQEFDVDVQLYNPDGAIVDSVRFFVEFDPRVLQVLDRDRGNWIRQGVNVHDGPFRLDFPFDFHMRNEVDNVRGRIQYAKGLSGALSLPTGTFARIRFRALQPIDHTEVSLIAGRPGARRLTTLMNFGFNVLSDDPEYTHPHLAFAVYPETPDRGPEVGGASPMDELRSPAHLFSPAFLPPGNRELSFAPSTPEATAE